MSRGRPIPGRDICVNLDKTCNGPSLTERLIRRQFGLMGMYDGAKTFMTVEFWGDFEAFNSRPYHNHESWGHGWKVTISGKGTATFEPPIAYAQCWRGHEFPSFRPSAPRSSP